MTDLFNRTLRAIPMATDLPIRLWPVSLVVLVLGIWSAWTLGKARKLQSKPVVLLLSTSVTVFFGLPVYAAAFWYRPHATPETQALPTDVLGALWWVYVAIVLILIASSKSFRLPLAGLASIFIWVNFSLFFFAAMAVSGVWL